MDNHSAYILGVDLKPPPPNIRIQWLPANSTSVYQPLDQGIRYIVASYKRGADPATQSQQELEELYQQVQHAGRIQDAMSLENFLNPIDEDHKPTQSDFNVANAIATYSQQLVEDESDDEGPPIQIPTPAQAEQALELLLLYQEHTDSTTPQQIRALQQLYTEAKAQKSKQFVQGTLDSWIT
ncbi:uncharacterized protein BDR25DRAFT_365633 [Lindgomyces ingoldianus]|uniref:Uncharacterized protein n=1 Tax=Lindgomyces ingoldianus TaxID=673940 RepID=A0ACB6RHY3_9PLEO|nr:uncharacterized protein BDR25DRAFT_365633 [Lindgomyces ingoldianus]KAF2478388.1 hypothetical protein BDR25DRAFT_365633 [Lindgomyces ingoldianus]